MMGNLVKSGKTYAQAVSGGATVDSDGFELVKSKNKRVGDQSTTGGSAVSPLSTLGSLGIRMPEGLKPVEEVPEWEEIEMVVDAGASESAVSDDMLTRVTTVEGYAQKKGVQYEVADGTLTPNLGEKKFVAVSDGGVTRQMKAHACEVNKACFLCTALFKREIGWSSQPVEALRRTNPLVRQWNLSRRAACIC